MTCCVASHLDSDGFTHIMVASELLLLETLVLEKFSLVLPSCSPHPHSAWPVPHHPFPFQLFWLPFVKLAEAIIESTGKNWIVLLLSFLFLQSTMIPPSSSLQMALVGTQGWWQKLIAQPQGQWKLALCNLKLSCPIRGNSRHFPSGAPLIN